MRLVLAIVLGLGLAACSQPSLDYADYLRAYDEARCERRVRCGLVPTVEACLSGLLDPLVADPEVVDAIEAGLVRFDPAVARGCLDHIATLTCDQSSAEARRPACLGLLTGTLPDGERCTSSLQCISRECWTGDVPCTDACCTGECVGDLAPVPGGVGDRCRLSPCIDSFCGGDSVCAPLRDLGEPCTHDAHCAYGLGCRGEACVALAGAGEACEPGRCRDFGAVCRDRTCQMGGLLGAPCLDDASCSPMYRCDVKQAVPSTGYFTCVPRLPTPIGAACDPWTGDTCEASAFCEVVSITQGRCAPRKADDQRCTHDRHCQSGRCNGLAVCWSQSCTASPAGST